MEKVHEVCNHCSEKHCCRGLCKEMNEFLINKKKDGERND